MRKTPVFLLLALMAGACRQHETSSTGPAAVEVAPVSEQTGGAGTRYSASVEPEKEVTVAFRVGGYVESVEVEEGDHVLAGAVLARIRRSDYAEKLGQASAQHQQAQASLAQARTDLDRAKALFAANALTKPELDAAEARFAVTSAQVSGGRAAATEAGITLRDTTLVAPIGGVILRRNIERGDLTMPGSAAFVLADTRTVKVLFGVPDMMVGALKIGQAIGVATESMPDRAFTGKVARIAPAADPKSRIFDVELHIDNPKDELKPGMVASLEVNRGNGATLAVPLAAVIRPPKSQEGYAVYVVEQNKARARVVELGEPLGNLVAVRAGLRGGDRVVTSGPAVLVDGQDVRVINGGAYAQK